MAGFGYSYVNDKGFIAFERDLSEGAWKDVSIKKHDAGDFIARSALAATPLVTVWKLRATWAIRALTKALEVDVLNKLDAEWDSAQRALSLFIGAAAEHQDAAHREAAVRLKAALLKDGGTAQTLLGFDQEVDFGRNQSHLTSTGQHLSDVKTIGAGAHLKRIHDATEALANGLGRVPGQNRNPSRFRRIRDGLAVCSTAFNGIHDEIEWAIDHTEPGEDRTALEALRAPFQALLERYPAPTSAAPALAGEVPAEPAPAAAPQATPKATG